MTWDTAALHAAMPFTALLGAAAVDVDAPEVRLRLDWHADRSTAGGLLHGGALMGLADAAGGLCAFLNLPEGATGTATISSATNFLRGVRAGHVEAVARPLHVTGGGVGVCYGYFGPHEQIMAAEHGVTTGVQPASG